MNEELGSLITEIREDNNLTQELMAEALTDLVYPLHGYTQEDISRYETGKAVDNPYRLWMVMVKAYAFSHGSTDWEYTYGKSSLRILYPQHPELWEPA